MLNKGDTAVPSCVPPEHRAEICGSVEDAHNYFGGGVLYLHMQYA